MCSTMSPGCQSVNFHRVKDITAQRKAIESEKARLAAAAEKVSMKVQLDPHACLIYVLQMSAKRLQRLKKKLGRSKSVYTAADSIVLLMSSFACRRDQRLKAHCPSILLSLND